LLHNGANHTSSSTVSGAKMDSPHRSEFKQKIENNTVKTKYNVPRIIVYCKINCNLLVNWGWKSVTTIADKVKRKKSICLSDLPKINQIIANE
jgi:hypothetical protein